jgi:PglZ domain
LHKTMGIVTDYVIKLVQQQIDKKGVVLWCDPLGVYAGLTEHLELPDTRLAIYRGSFLALRREVDGLLNDVQSDIPPRLVIYYPAELGEARHALDEFALAGVLVGPSEAVPRNTSFGVITREALHGLMTAEKLAKILEQVRAGQLSTLAELDRVAEHGGGLGLGVLKLIFETDQAADIALRFVTDPSLDTELVQKAALPELAALLAPIYGADMPASDPPAEARARLHRHLLITEFVAAVQGPLPPILAAVKVPGSPARDACVHLVRVWRNRRDLQESYSKAAATVQRDYGLDSINLDWTALSQVETFPAVEAHLQTAVEQALLVSPRSELIALAEARRSNFWSEADPTVRARWSLTLTAGQLLRLAADISTVLNRKAPATAADYVDCYTAGPQPWCQLDTYHRVFERLALNLDLDPHGADASLERLQAGTRQRYTALVDELARRFAHALAEAGFALGDYENQTEVFSRHVAPAIAGGKTAYMLVDALRFEMARELVVGLGDTWQAELIPAIGTAPTITPVGMGALLPGAERGLSLVDTGRGLAPEIGGQILKDRKDRIAYLRTKLDGLVDVKLDELVPARKAAREKVKDARTVLVTSQEIDLLGEGDNVPQAREFMDSALGKLSRAFRTLADLGVQRIIVAADHGYLFGEELDTDTTLDAPGGHTVDLHRRVWVGKGGRADAEVLRISAQALNLGGDLELATPYGLVGFAVPGGRTYFHGGLSLQELIIPVLTLAPQATPVSASIDWILTPGSHKLSSRFFSVVVGGRVAGMFDAGHPRVRVEVHARNKPISVVAAATYGYFEGTGEVEMRLRADNPHELEPNTVMLMINGETDQKTVSIVLMEGDGVAKTFDRIEVAIAF